MVKEKPNNSKKEDKIGLDEQLKKEQIEFYKGQNKKIIENDRKIDCFKKSQKKSFIVILVISFIVFIALFLIYYFFVAKSLYSSFILGAIGFFFAITISDFAFSKDEKRYEFNIKLILELITILILMGQLIVTSGQFNLQRQQGDILDKQTQIIQQTSQSNKADLFLVSSQGDRAYSLDTLENGETLAIGVINAGKTIAPFAQIKLMSSKNFIGRERDNNGYGFWDIKELSGLNYTATFFTFKENGAYGNISVGEYNITFSIDCPFCEQPYKEENITICIFNKASNKEFECNNSKWRYAN
jgi:hypothetical protein